MAARGEYGNELLVGRSSGGHGGHGGRGHRGGRGGRRGRGRGRRFFGGGWGGPWGWYGGWPYYAWASSPYSYEFALPDYAADGRQVHYLMGAEAPATSGCFDTCPGSSFRRDLSF